MLYGGSGGSDVDGAIGPQFRRMKRFSSTVRVICDAMVVWRLAGGI